MANEGSLYHETREPFYQSADFTAVSPITTSISMVPVLRVPATALSFPAGYWRQPGKRWLIRMFWRQTHAATPGNFTYEIRYQTGTPTDAGGTILATSAATAATATKTAISMFGEFIIEARGDASTFVPTASPLFAYGCIWTDSIALMWSAANANGPLMVPAASAAAVNVDTTLAGTIHIDAKRSGSTAEAITVHDLAVNAMT